MKILSFLMMILSLAACTLPADQTPAGAAAKPQTLTVLAAASLTAPFTEIGALFETQHPGVHVSFSFAGSQQLAQQLGQGASADVFASASSKYMESVVEQKRVDPASAKIFAKNRLVVIYPKDNPAGLRELKDLANPGLKLDLADKSVPVGQYALDFLDKTAQDPAFGPAFKDNVLNNVVSYEENVKSVLTKVALGEADAGIVYETDIGLEAAEQVGTITIPDALNTLAAYPIAPIAGSPQAGLANAFVSLVLSADGQAILAKHDFLPAGE